MTEEKKDARRKKANNVISLADRKEIEPARNDARSSTKGGTRDYGWKPDCPITPLGKEGEVIYVLDARNQIHSLNLMSNHRQTIISMIGGEKGIAWLERNYANTSAKKSRKADWDYTRFMDTLIVACDEKGFWQSKNIRGRGAWSDNTGRLYYNLGTRLLASLTSEEQEKKSTHYTEHKVGIHKPYVYSAGVKIPAPAKDLVLLENYRTILSDLLGKWNWRNETGDVIKLIGWLVCANLGAATEWRPHIWIIGSANSGKTTLTTKVIREILNEWCIGSEDQTRASIQQKLGKDSLAVVLDEFETEAGRGHVENIVDMARLASNRSVTMRGTASGKNPIEYRLNSAFYMSSINQLSLRPQDASRITNLILSPVSQYETLEINAQEMREVGNLMRANNLACWHKFPEILEKIKKYMQNKYEIVDARMMDQYGHLLTGYYVWMYGANILDRHIEITVDQIKDDIEERRAGTSSDALACFEKLMSWELVMSHGKRVLLSQYLQDIHRGLQKGGQQEQGVDLFLTARDSIEKLRSFGLRIVQFEGVYQCKYSKLTRYTGKILNAVDPQLPFFLAVPYFHPKLAEAFRGSDWASQSNTSAGGWKTSLERHPLCEPLSSRMLIRVVPSGAPKNVLLFKIGGFNDEVQKETTAQGLITLAKKTEEENPR